MKKVLVVAALLAVMLVVRSLKQLGVPHAATLAGIGFVMLAAYAVAELGKSLSLPQVTGYILAGVVLGPSVGSIISGEVVAEMRMFNTLALGLIAISAGLELDVRQLVRLAKTLVFTTLIKVLVGVSLVAGALLAVETALGSLGLEGQGQLLTLALVIGVLSLGTSPSITLAVLSETRAKGRLADLVLGAAVFKDLVVIVGLAIAVALGRVLLQPAATLDAGVLADVASELAGSLVAGAIVGAIFIVYVRFIRAEMLLFVSAVILVVAELCRAFHLELLLVFISAGFVVRNLSKFERNLMQPLQLVALPVFVVFFANAGASIDLVTTWQILPVALAVCACRAIGYYLASRLGGKWAGESAAIQKHAWLAYLPQAGVTLGLVGLAGLQLPELVTPITNTGMAVVALNLLIGPVALRRALALAGELPSVTAEAGAAVQGSRSSEATLVPAPAQRSSEPANPVAALPPSLRQAGVALREAIGGVLQNFHPEHVASSRIMPELGNDAPDLETFRQIVVLHRAAYQALYADLTSVLGQLPQVVECESSERSRSWRRFTPWKLERGRKLPLRRLARIALDPAMARYVVRSFEEGLRTRAQGAPRLASVAQPGTASDAATLPAELERGLVHFGELMRDAGTRRLPTRRLRYSEVEPQIRQQLQSLENGTDADFARLARASWGSDLLAQRRAQVLASAREIVSRCVVTPALATARKVGPAVAVLTDWLEQRRARLEAVGISGPELARLRADFDKLQGATLGELAREFRFAVTVRTTVAELQASVEQLPGSIECLAQQPGAPLSRGKVISVPLREHVDAYFRHIMPALDLASRSVAAALSQVPRRVDDAIKPEWTLLDAQVDMSEVEEIQALAGERLLQAKRRVERVTRVTERAVDSALAAFVTSLDIASTTFASDMLAGPPTLANGDARLQSKLLRLRQALRAGSGLLRAALSGAPRLPDAASVRRALPELPSAVPDVVERWFDGSPVSDERVFSAHRDLLEQILDAESTRAQMGHASILIVGSKSSGKSSLLNMCEMEVPSTLHLRLHANDFRREATLFEALGTLLESPATHAGLRRLITLRRPAIFVDDLGRWISSGVHHQRELQGLLQLIADTRGEAFWVVSVDESMLHLLKELEDVEEVFTHVLPLPPLTLAEVQRLVQSRLEQLNVEVTFQPSTWARALAKLTGARESERFYRALWEASGGVPARVIKLCRRAFSMDRHGLTLRAEAITVSRLPAYDFSEIQLAILANLQRYGPQPVSGLERELAVSVEKLQRSLAFLTACGLVSSVDEGHALAIAPSAEWVVHETLVNARLALS